MKKPIDKEPVYFHPRDTRTGKVVRTPVYIDQEGNVYKDSDPYGVQMNGSRRIIPAPEIEIEYDRND